MDLGTDDLSLRKVFDEMITMRNDFSDVEDLFFIDLGHQLQNTFLKEFFLKLNVSLNQSSTKN